MLEYQCFQQILWRIFATTEKLAGGTHPVEDLGTCTKHLLKCHLKITFLTFNFLVIPPLVRDPYYNVTQSFFLKLHFLDWSIGYFLGLCCLNAISTRQGFQFWLHNDPNFSPKSTLLLGVLSSQIFTVIIWPGNEKGHRTRTRWHFFYNFYIIFFWGIFCILPELSDACSGEKGMNADLTRHVR